MLYNASPLKLHYPSTSVCLHLHFPAAWVESRNFIQYCTIFSLKRTLVLHNFALCFHNTKGLQRRLQRAIKKKKKREGSGELHISAMIDSFASHNNASISNETSFVMSHTIKGQITTFNKANNSASLFIRMPCKPNKMWPGWWWLQGIKGKIKIEDVGSTTIYNIQQYTKSI